MPLAVVGMMPLTGPTVKKEVVPVICQSSLTPFALLMTRVLPLPDAMLAGGSAANSDRWITKRTGGCVD